MNVYVWNRVEKCTDNWHTEGGIVVFAESMERARELANAHKGCVIADDEAPDDVRRVDGGNEAVYIMPDAGCC
jgi:hypothetical protein